ncbi:MAG: hypothetical protein K0S86_2836 [Geminicoccaceae bacterium]|jgi:hypothetical protein|nr:hypothetical protein [Geminicoccaceae bacterium]
MKPVIALAALFISACAGSPVVAKGCFHVWGGEAPPPIGMIPDHDYYDPRTGKWSSLRGTPIPVHGVVGSAFADGLI